VLFEVFVVVPLATVSRVSIVACQKLPPPKRDTEKVFPSGILAPAVRSIP